MDLKDKIGEFSGELHQGILNSYLKDGSIYMMPLKFRVPVFLTTQKTEGAVESLERLVACSERYHGIADKMTYGDAIYLLYNYFTLEIIDEQSFVNQKNLKEFLSLLKRFCKSEGAAEYLVHSIPNKDYRHSITLAMGDSQLGFENISGISALGVIPQVLKDVGGKMIPRKEAFSPMGILGVNNFSLNMNSALLFLDKAFSEEVQKIKSGEAAIGFPVRS
jgi:hypothetical protein